MNQKKSLVNLAAVAGFVGAAFLSACSSDSSSASAVEESSESQVIASSSSESVGESSAASSSSVEGISSGTSGLSSAADDEDDSEKDESNTDTDSLSTSTWLTWDVPSSPTSGTVSSAVLDTAVRVTLSDAGFTVDNAKVGTSISVSGNKLLVGGAGTYVFSGSMADGQILVTASETETVEFIFNGVMLGNSENSPVFFVSGNKLKIELAEGSVNILSDARAYQYMAVASYTEADSVPKACLYGRDDMTLKGNGTLYVTGNYNNGIHTKADLIINDSPTIYVNAVNNAIKGKGSVRIKEGGTYYLRTGDGNGISSDKEGRTDKGRVCLSAGNYTMDVGNAGIKASLTDSIGGGTYTIHSTGDALHATTLMVYSGAFDIETGDEGFFAEGSLYLRGGSAVISKSSKPFVAASGMTVSGGDWFGLGGGFVETMVPTAAEFYTAAFTLPADILKGAVVTVENSSGAQVYSAVAGKDISSLFAASPDFGVGTYSVSADGVALCRFTFTADSKVATVCTAD